VCDEYTDLRNRWGQLTAEEVDNLAHFQREEIHKLNMRLSGDQEDLLRLQAIVDKWPKTVDRVSIVPKMMVWIDSENEMLVESVHKNGLLELSKPGITLWKDPCDVYSTQGAAICNER